MEDIIKPQKKQNKKNSSRKQKKKSSKKSVEELEQIKWTAPEFTKYKKSKKWFIFLWVISVALIITALAFANILLAIAILLACFVIYIYAKKEPKKINFLISEKGVKIDDKWHEYNDLKSFWIFYDPPEISELSLRSQKMTMPYIKIPIDKQNPVKIRRLLLRYLPEKKHNESVVDKWMRKIKF